MCAGMEGMPPRHIFMMEVRGSRATATSCVRVPRALWQLAGVASVDLRTRCVGGRIGQLPLLRSLASSRLQWKLIDALTC